MIIYQVKVVLAYFMLHSRRWKCLEADRDEIQGNFRTLEFVVAQLSNQKPSWTCEILSLFIYTHFPFLRVES